MHRIYYSFLLSLGFIVVQAQTDTLAASNTPETDWVQYVRPLMGTLNGPDLSNGNIYPAIATPWGMNFWTAQTENMKSGWHYLYTSPKIKGLRQGTTSK